MANVNLAELKNLNMQDPGGWPWLAKIIAFVMIFVITVGAVAYFDWQEQWNQFESLEREEGDLRNTYLERKKKAINLDLIKNQLNEIKESFGALLKQLPSKSEMDALLTDINQAGLGRGLQFELFRPQAEIVNGAFAEQPITIKVTGTYDDFGRFASDVAMLPRIVTLNNVSITPLGGANNAANATSFTLTMDATAKTFRYLEEGGDSSAGSQEVKK